MLYTTRIAASRRATAFLAVATALIAPRSSPAAEEIRVNPSGPPARSYSTSSELSGEWARLSSEIARLPGAPHLSRCLSRAAAHYADHRGPGGDDRLPQAAIEFLLHRAGCPDATASATVVYTTEHGTEDVLAELRTLLSHLEFADTTHVGLGPGRGEGDPYQWRWGIFLTTRRFELKSFPGTADPGDILPIQVRLDPGLADPRIILLAPDDGVREVPVGASGTWAVAPIDVGWTPGTLWVELIADTTTGPAVLALFPVEIGGDPPRDWRGPPPPDESTVQTGEDAARLMLKLLKRDRARHGLPALRWNDELAEAATAQSRDMAANGFFGHRSPRRGDLVERLHRSDISVLYSAENLSRADSIAEAQQSLMRSPGHRANILSTSATEVGIGIVREDGVGHGWLVTQLFAKLRPHLTEMDWRRAVLDKLRQRFSAEGRRPPAVRPELDEVAVDLAGQQATDDASDLAELASALLDGQGFDHRALLVHTLKTWTVEQLKIPDPSRAPAGAEVGIGIHSGAGDRPVFIVVLFVR